jgi:hypothetical protein
MFVCVLVSPYLIDYYYLKTADLGKDLSLLLETSVGHGLCLGLGSELGGLLHTLVELGGSLLSLGGELLNELLALPTGVLGHITEDAESSLGLQFQRLEGLRDDHLLLPVIGRWDTVVNSESLESSLTSGSLVGEHTTDSSPENHRRSGVVKRTPLWISSGSLVAELLVLQLISVKRARNVDSLTSDDGDVLTVEDLLCNNRGEAAE